ncbi:GreA/GreB family elongation factor [Hymenobacter sp. 5516J-16]|uniref:GreA/GreB family elongation factor n=1 Tax=Hymenobacter sp. 5516J-16 TaxID=2932253 RepID=UPI001FD4A35B|nr:GreA/GreB family elongation factor [Hymenobacter sp. 5516J-16]UOQ76528.1 GreA/GreB family elongation factor [Hymenobacter sp. 5516J-16]
MKYYITEAGRQLLETRINEQNLKIRSIQAEKSIAYTASGDGWHDNPGYNQLIQLEERAITELKNLEQQLASGVLWLRPDRNTAQVQIGSIVRFSMQAARDRVPREVVYEIGGHGESDLGRQLISYTSPIGAALYELLPGAEVEVQIPAGRTKLRILGLYGSWDDVRALAARA